MLLCPFFANRTICQIKRFVNPFPLRVLHTNSYGIHHHRHSCKRQGTLPRSVSPMYWTSNMAKRQDIDLHSNQQQQWSDRTRWGWFVIRSRPVLNEWVERNKHLYATIYMDATNVEKPVQKYGQHEWNPEWFSVLAKIRQDSIQFAIDHHSHYFVVDCDNFIHPHTLEAMFQTGLQVVAPLLYTGNTYYSNYHNVANTYGYYEDNPLYYSIWEGKVKGLIQVDVVHCTYFVRNEVLPLISYIDGTTDYEYVIFSRNLRSQKIPQYLDNRVHYGRITFTENETDFQKEPWIKEFVWSIQHYIWWLSMSIFRCWNISWIGWKRRGALTRSYFSCCGWNTIKNIPKNWSWYRFSRMLR